MTRVFYDQMQFTVTSGARSQAESDIDDKQVTDKM